MNSVFKFLKRCFSLVVLYFVLSVSLTLLILLPAMLGLIEFSNEFGFGKMELMSSVLLSMCAAFIGSMMQNVVIQHARLRLPGCLIVAIVAASISLPVYYFTSSGEFNVWLLMANSFALGFILTVLWFTVYLKGSHNGE